MLILASKSPRRRELLRQLGEEEFEILPAVGEETAPAGLTPAELVEALSRQKAAEVAEKAGAEDIILAADTVVALDGRVLGKPATEREAFEMLSALSGRRHEVYTGVTVRRGACVLTDSVETSVFFRTLTSEEIRAYIATGEPMDKAGAYGIQGRAAVFIPRIEGDYSNVVGLPVCRTAELLRQLKGGA